MQRVSAPLLEAQQRPIAPVPASANTPASPSARLRREIAINELTVTEYDHFVSFCARDDNGAQILLQYRRDQVWLDESGVWQVGAAQEPFYIWRSASPPRTRNRLCTAISLALADPAIAQPRD